MKQTVILVALFTLSVDLSAQWSASGSFMVGAPQGQFSTNVGTYGFGVGGTIEYAPQEYPIGVGLKIGFLNYGSETRREPFSTTIPDVTVQVATNNNFFILNLEGRVQPNTGVFRPYVSGTLGANVLTTSTTIKNESTNEEVASSTNQSDTAFNYGAGGGLDVRVWTKDEAEETEDGSKIKDVSVHAGFTYLKGGEADYLKKGSIRRVNGKVVYDVLRSSTDIILYSLGVSVSF